jgi:hypothetical protein
LYLGIWKKYKDIIIRRQITAFLVKLYISSITEGGQCARLVTKALTLTELYEIKTWFEFFVYDQYRWRYLFETWNITIAVLVSSAIFAAVKSCPVPHFSVVIFFWSFGIIMTPTLLSVENWLPLKPVIGGLRDVACFHNPSC